MHWLRFGILSFGLVFGNFGATQEMVSAERKLTLSVSSDKREYLLHEPVRIGVTLRNDGTTPLWLTDQPAVGRQPGAFIVTVTGADGHELPNSTPITGQRVRVPACKLNPFDELIEERMAFMPGDFLGFTRSLQDLYVKIDKPGKYYVVVSYYDEPYLKSGKKITDELRKEARFPIWTSRIQSEALEITIR